MQVLDGTLMSYSNSSYMQGWRR